MRTSTRTIDLFPARVNLSDRALRYRAQSHAEELGEKRCAFCGSTRNVEIEHVNGFEEHGSPDNLTWGCRRCNTVKGAFFARRGIGLRTVQYNPAVHRADSLG